MKKITRFIHTLLRKWDADGYSATAINTGCCEEFALELQKRFPRGVAIWGYADIFKTNVDPEGHCFFKYGKRYYDSECKNGVEFPDDLPYYQRAKKQDDEYWKKDKEENRKTA